MKKILKLAGLGFLLGIAARDFIAILTTNGDSAFSPEFVERVGDMKIAMLVSTLLSGLYGAVCMAGVMLYEADRLPLSVSTLLHCLICIIPFAPLSLFLGWSDGIISILIIAGFQLAAFFIVWLIMYCIYKREIRKLNEIQNQTHNDTEGEEK